MKKLILISMLIPFIITFTVFFVAKSTPDYSEDRKPIEDEQVEQTLIEIVQNYKRDMVEATNNGDFGDIEHYLVNNHTYRNVRAYMNQLQNSGFDNKIELIDQTIGDVYYYYLDDIPIYCVDATEKVRVVENDVEEIEEDELRYELIEHNDKFLIESIIRREE